MVVEGNTHEKIYWHSWHWIYMLLDICYLMDRKKSGKKLGASRCRYVGLKQTNEDGIRTADQLMEGDGIIRITRMGIVRDRDI